MTNPTTYKGESGGTGATEWNDGAALLRNEDSGVGYQFKTIRRGTFAELIRFILTLSEDEQNDYAIQKSGDRRFEIAEIRTLAASPDFPKS